MKKLICVVLLAAVFAQLCACSVNDEQTTVTSAETEPAVSKMVTIDGPCSKDGVPAFMKTLGELQAKGSFSGYKFSEGNCYNVTPAGLKEETGGTLFKFGDSCLSLLLLDGKVYELSAFIGVYGLMSAVPCDFDGDGKKDILYTYTGSSDAYHSQMAVFNTRTKKSVDIHSPLDENGFVSGNGDIIVGAPTGSPAGENAPVEYPVYYAMVTARDGNFAALQFALTGIIGFVKEVDGVPGFVRIL